MVKQDICVLEEPGCQYQGGRNASNARLRGEGEEYCENDQDACGSAAGWAEKMAEDFGLLKNGSQAKVVTY